MTENEAKKKECRIGILSMCIAAGNLNKEMLEALGRCSASNCMFWRWTNDKPPCRFEKYHTNSEATIEPIPRPLNIPASWGWMPYDASNDCVAGWMEPINEADERRKGYCGLSGKVNA